MPPDSFKERARVGFTKGAAYDQHRPSYPAAAVQVLLDNMGLAGQHGARVLDLAAGTGKFTEALAAREEQFEITAVEPHADMRRVLEEKNLPRTRVDDGRADSIPLAEGAVDGVVCAQAFHWFANKESLREINRVLARHGSLGMIWNMDDYNAEKDHPAATEWETKVHQIIWSLDDNEPRYRHAKWREVFEQQVKSTPLSLLTAGDDEQMFSLPLGEHEEPYEEWLSREKIWERFATLSHVAVLEGEERERVYRDFMDALNGPEVVTDQHGHVAVHGNAVVVWTSKIPTEGRNGLTEVEKPGE